MVGLKVNANRYIFVNGAPDAATESLIDKITELNYILKSYADTTEPMTHNTTCFESECCGNGCFITDLDDFLDKIHGKRAIRNKDEYYPDDNYSIQYDQLPDLNKKVYAVRTRNNNILILDDIYCYESALNKKTHFYDLGEKSYQELSEINFHFKEFSESDAYIKLDGRYVPGNRMSEFLNYMGYSSGTQSGYITMARSVYEIYKNYKKTYLEYCRNK